MVHQLRARFNHDTTMEESSIMVARAGVTNSQQDVCSMRVRLRHRPHRAATNESCLALPNTRYALTLKFCHFVTASYFVIGLHDPNSLSAALSVPLQRGVKSSWPCFEAYMSDAHVHSPQDAVHRYASARLP